MATPRMIYKEGPHEVRVHIGLDANGQITVDPDPFWIYEQEEEQVRWVCVQRHKHGDSNNPCFTIDFDGGITPFNEPHFEGHGALSDRPTKQAIRNKEYKYTVTIGGQTLDPSGGVRP